MARMASPLLLLALVATASEEPAPLPRLSAGALSAPVRVDAVLDEPDWTAAPLSSPLRMVEPREGAPPTMATEVRVLAGPRELVFGLRCLDPSPSAIVTFTKERDGDFTAEDHVALLLAPFRDGRSGYLFAVNPGGARFDALVQPGGEDVDPNWDGQWEAAARRDERGWTAEIRIPVDVLAFDGTRREWGFNVQRRVERLQETSRWAGAVQDSEVFQPSRAGVLAGLPRFDLGLGLAVRPSLVGGFRAAEPGAATDSVLGPSLDVSKRLGPGVLASLTLDTDFAETEVDTRRTNLTRFPLFFPEKRTFFLEGADLFSFGIGIDEGSLVPLFSRRIGLVGEDEVPLRAGLKATGRVGETSFAGLVVRTGEKGDLAPAATMGALRVRRNLFAESRAGLLVTAGDPLGRKDATLAGLDFTYQTSSLRGDKNLLAGAWVLVAGREDLRGSRGAFGLKLDYPNDLWDCFALYRRIGEGFDPSLGFVPRRGIDTYRGGCTYAPRPDGGSVRQMFFRAHPTLVTDLEGGWESYEVDTTPLSLQLESGEVVALRVVPQGERLREPFEVAEGIFIGQGTYDWWRLGLELESAARRRLSGELTVETGGFYAGTLHTVELAATWTPSALLTLQVTGQHDRGRVDGGAFDLTLAGARVRLNLSPDVQFAGFLQYDTEDEAFGSNTRLRWTFRPSGDLFVIYNHDLVRTRGRFRRDASELLVKVQYTFKR